MAERNQTKKLGVVRRSRTPSTPVGPIATEAEARRLTDQILNDADGVFRLVKEAHDRQIWVPLGYTGWDEYLKKELNLSQREGFRLLAKGRVVHELESETGTKLPTKMISVRDAEVLQKQPEERRRIIRQAQKAPEEERVAVIRDEVRTVREKAGTSTNGQVSATRGSKRAPGGPLPADVTEAMTTVAKRLHSFIDQGLPQKMGLSKAKRFYDKVLDPLLGDIERWREQVEMLESREASASR